MANIGGAFYPVDCGLPYDVAQDSGIAESLRSGLANFSTDSHVNMVLFGTAYAADKNHGSFVPASGAHLGTGIVPGLFDIIYNNVMIYPSFKELGTITEAQSFVIVLWNTSVATQNITLSRTAWDGLLDDGGGTLVLKSTEYRKLTIDVTMNGPADIAATLQAFCESFGATFIVITGKRGEIWNFAPKSGMKERWEWLTEISTSWDHSERREALRLTPRQIVECDYDLRFGDAATRLEIILYTRYFYYFFFPRFEQQVSATVHAGDMIIQCDTSASVWSAGMVATLYSNDYAEQIGIAAVSDGSLSLDMPVGHDFGACLLMPCDRARMMGQSSRKDNASQYSAFSAKFLLESPPLWTVPDDSAVTMLFDTDVWDIPLLSPVSYTWDCPVITLDSGISPPRQFHARPLAGKSYQVRLLCHGMDEIMQMRGIILRRQGCVRPFWASSRRQDLLIVAPIKGNTDKLIIAPLGTATAKLVEARQVIALRIELTDGTVLFRYTLAAEMGAGADKVQLTEPLFVERDVQPEEFQRVSFMVVCRLASDEVEWTWKRPDYAEVSLAVQEVS